ncbi:unnamed protein product [Amoebophrya sp. A25]|nr:unnamed protein product [Amoebophrya sp. A25]|eukprot:GSA25T00011577001.1
MTQRDSRRKRVVALIYRIAAKRISEDIQNATRSGEAFDIHDVALEALRQTRAFLDAIGRILEAKAEGLGETCAAPEATDPLDDVLEAGTQLTLDPPSGSPGIYAGTFAACTRALRRSHGGGLASQRGGRVVLDSLSCSPPTRRYDPRRELSPLSHFRRKKNLPPLNHTNKNITRGGGGGGEQQQHK